MIQAGSFCIVNNDSPLNLIDMDFTNLCPLTCGLSVRSTVTASSIRDDGFTYCLQRSIFDLSGQEIAPQEFAIFWREKPEDIYPYLELVTLLLLCGVSGETLSHFLF